MASTKDEATRLIFVPNVQHNSALYTVKFLSSCFAGAVAGILGLENWQGFVLFLVSLLLTGACTYVVNCKGRPAKYVPGGVRELVNPGQDNVFSFVLVWTLFYGMLHVFLYIPFYTPAVNCLLNSVCSFIISAYRYRPWYDAILKSHPLLGSTDFRFFLVYD